MRPIIRQSSAEKIFKYFFGENWKKYPVVELAIRHKKINLFDDELYVWNKTLNQFKTFTWNADPSAFRIGEQAIAILRTGVHFYKLSYHHIWDNSKRYVALRPNTPGNKLPVLRKNANGKEYFSVGTAINQHAGGDRTTGSRGCQTAPRSQYGEFIRFIGNGFGVEIPIGIQRKPEKRFQDGIGNIPYVLIDQADFDYIINLPESQFDSQADLLYQQTNFVNIPKTEKRMPIISAPSANAEQILAEIAEQEKQAALDAETTEENVGQKIDDLRSSAIVPANISAEINNQLSASSSVDNTSSADSPNQSTLQIEQSPIDSGAVETTEIQTETETAQITETKNEQSVHEPAEVKEPKPQGVFAKLSGGIGALFSGTFIYTIAEKFGGITISQTLLILIIVAVVLAFLGFCFWAALDAWKSAKRTEIEVESKTNVNKKDVKWV